LQNIRVLATKGVIEYCYPSWAERGVPEAEVGIEPHDFAQETGCKQRLPTLPVFLMKRTDQPLKVKLYVKLVTVPS
jgi:hypothetical protein